MYLYWTVGVITEIGPILDTWFYKYKNKHCKVVTKTKITFLLIYMYCNGIVDVVKDVV